MHASATWSIAVLLAFGCAGTGARPVVVKEESTVSGIQVMGRGEVRARPDVAVVDVGVEARRPTVAEARETATIAQSAVLAALRGAGIPAEDVQTTQLTVRPEYEHTEAGQNLVGYVATNLVQIRVRDLERVQHAIDTALTAGGDLVRLSGLSFELSDPENAQRLARARAIEDARAEARHIAAQLGVALGQPIAVEEVSSEPPVRQVAMRLAPSDRAEATPIAPGTSDVRVELRVRWAIAPGRAPEPARARLTAAR